MTRHGFAFTLLCVGLAMLQSCAPSTKFLQKDQYLYAKSKIKGNKHVDTDALINLQQQKPNRTLLGFMPYLWFYQQGQKLYKKEKIRAKIDRTRKKYDDKIAKEKDPASPRTQRLRNLRDQKLDKLNTTLEEGNWLMRTVGEPPVIYDNGLTAQTQTQMKNYLFNKGYFDGKVTATTDTTHKKRRIKVTYRIDEGLPQRVRSVKFFAFNPNLQKIMDSVAKEERLVRKEQVYDQDKISAEREAIDKAIRNSGYYAFSRDYIFIEADTSINDSAFGTRGIDLLYKIKDPTSGEHVKYNIDEIEYYIQNTGGFTRSDTNTVVINNIAYHAPYKKLAYRILDSKILVRPGDYYHADKLNNSQAQLQTMDIFRFVNFAFDSIGAHQFRLNITSTRLPKFQISDEIGVLVSQGAPGPFANVGIKVRNGLNKFDIFEASVSYSDEGQISFFENASVYRATEFRFNTALTFPAFMFPGRISYLFNNKNPKTRLTATYADVSRPEYRRQIVKGTFGYTLNLSKNEVVGVNLIDASYVYTNRLDTAFQNYLSDLQRQGNSLSQSFRSSVVTSLSAFYVYNTTSQFEKKRGWYLRVFGEWGGELPTLIANGKSEDGQDMINKLQVFKFARIQTDFRYYYPISKTGILVGRVNTGVAVPRGNSRALPWEKYFFTGGSSSNRAWPPRRLGPGSYNGRKDANIGRFIAEQPGEILVELNVELRQKLFGFVEGALFADASNVYTLQPERARPGSEFKFSSFLPNLALGTGVGLRLDFSFLVIRLDLGIKTYDPAEPAGARWVIKDLFKKRNDDYQKALLNIGIGYPF